MQVNGFKTWMAPVALGSCQMNVGVFCVGSLSRHSRPESIPTEKLYTAYHSIRSFLASPRHPFLHYNSNAPVKYTETGSVLNAPRFWRSSNAKCKLKASPHLNGNTKRLGSEFTLCILFVCMSCFVKCNAKTPCTGYCVTRSLCWVCRWHSWNRLSSSDLFSKRHSKLSVQNPRTRAIRTNRRIPKQC